MDLQRPEPSDKQTNTTKQQIVASASSSPSHEFSFALSLQSSSTSNQIDLTPADEIFFHGHLLPLHLLPTNSLDDSTLVDQRIHHNIDGCLCRSCDDKTSSRGHSFNSYEYNTKKIREHLNHIDEFPSKGRTKANSFSLFGLARRRKEGEILDQGVKLDKKKARFDMTHFLKRYTRMFSKGRAEDIQSISATSRSHSPPCNDSTMEELQAAIQAAIAHCKGSISAT